MKKFAFIYKWKQILLCKKEIQLTTPMAFKNCTSRFSLISVKYPKYSIVNSNLKLKFLTVFNRIYVQTLKTSENAYLCMDEKLSKTEQGRKRNDEA